MAHWLACAYVTNTQLMGGDFAKDIEALLAQPRPEPPPLDGAQKAAEHILAAL
jgi:hypothetical protein